MQLWDLPFADQAKMLEDAVLQNLTLRKSQIEWHSSFFVTYLNKCFTCYSTVCHTRLPHPANNRKNLFLSRSH